MLSLIAIAQDFYKVSGRKGWHRGNGKMLCVSCDNIVHGLPGCTRNQNVIFKIVIVDANGGLTVDSAGIGEFHE